ncbi:M23 family metallopeptidase [Campylobacterota bacterium DY0563]
MRRQKNSLLNIVFGFVFILIIAGGGFVYFSPLFEKQPAKIVLNSSGFWNLKDSLSVDLFDESGIKSYKIYYKSGNNIEKLSENTISAKQEKVVLNIKPLPLRPNIKEVIIAIEVYDNSFWNFFQGNKSYKEYKLNIDKKRPIARVISNSYNIKRGGSAALVVEARDENLKDKYITFNNEYRFELIPYLKEGFYAAIIAWPIDIKFDEFSRVNLVAIDQANNETTTKVPFYIKDLKIKNDKLTISDNFINKVSVPVLQKSDYEIPNTNEEIFIKQNRELRANNVNTIKEESINNMSKEMITSFNIKPFRRLSGSKTFAGFAERREYSYDGHKIDEAWHLGMDWASIKHADVKISNNGKVIFNNYLGIYGNTLIVDHGFGLQTLYAHTSQFQVTKGDDVRAGQIIANTGSTGAVFGDHLHFGVLVQGIEVNPIEWMDRNWIKTRISNILAEAKQEIRSSK